MTGSGGDLPPPFFKEEAAEVKFCSNAQISKKVNMLAEVQCNSTPLASLTIPPPAPSPRPANLRQSDDAKCTTSQQEKKYRSIWYYSRCRGSEFGDRVPAHSEGFEKQTW